MMIYKSDKSNKLSTELKKRLNNFASNSTLHGISGFTKSKKLLTKVFWLVCVLTSATLCFILISKNIDEYLDFPVTTKTRYEF